MKQQAAKEKREIENESEQRNPWEQYEQRKAELANQGLSPSEYGEACRRIADELGI